jgi:integrase
MSKRLKKFTQTEVDSLAPGGAPYFAQSGVRNLSVRVMPSGNKSYFFSYRFPRGREGKKRSISHECGIVTVRQITDLAARWNGLLADGIDPREQIETEAREVIAEQNAETLESVGRKFIQQYAKPRNRNWREGERMLERHVFPRWGKRPMHAIRRGEVVELLDEVATAHPVAADRLLAQIRKFFNWYALRDENFVSPVVRGMARTRPSEIARTRVLSDVELRALFRALEHCDRPYSQLVRLLLLTAARRDEIAMARWADLHDDHLIVPAARVKTKRDHLIPLSDAAKSVLSELTRGRPLHFVLSTTEGKRAFSGFSKAKARLDKLILEELRKTEPKAQLEDWRLHDLRRTARTLMSRAGVRPDISERVLGHVIPGVQGVYDRHSYEKERREALEALSRQIDAILNGNESNVLQFRRPAADALPVQ